MSSKLIRCLCGEMFDPEANTACPACGRPSKPQAQPKPAVGRPPKPKPAPVARPRVTTPSLSVSGWFPLVLGGGVVLILLVWLFSSSDDDIATVGDSRVTDRSRGSPVDACRSIAGDWNWFTGGFVHFASDGKAFFKPTEESPPAVTANWTCDESAGTYTVSWSHGFTETIKLYDNGQVIQGSNNVGVAVSGKRYVNPAAGMPPMQTVAAGSQQIPSNLPALAKAAQRVATDWRPDAILVGLRIREEGRLNTQTDFYVQQEFVSPSEQTGLWVTIKLTGSKIREAGTVSWSQRELPLDFIDLPEAARVARKAGMRGLVDRAELNTRDKSRRPTWFIAPELHGQGASVVDAITGELLPRR